MAGKSAWKEEVRGLRNKGKLLGTQELCIEFSKSVKRAVNGAGKVAVLFSGGVDSTALAVTAKKHSSVTLITASAENAPDTQVARETAKKLGLEWEHVPLTRENVKEYYNEVKDLLPKKLQSDFQTTLAIPIYAACKRARNLGLKVALDAAGADESFAGYHRYARLVERHGHDALTEELWKDLENIEEHDVEREKIVSGALGVEIRCPFLDSEFLKHAMAIPVSQKIHGKGDTLRKRALRKMALALGVPEEIAHRPKKAMQYGSGVEKLLKPPSFG
ncbi:MAG TPA: asparagine synthase C-terminal domain-containing protein [archaeon]|nr:asparagine synthase C-terminal domain-containing protein [archaeon]HLD81338.1 asparagine synthase C-terminal domain-containing protein [archaeon]